LGHLALSLGDRLRQHQLNEKREAFGARTGKTTKSDLASGFLGGCVKVNTYASYYLMEKELSLEFPPLIGDIRHLQQDLELVPGIGPKTAERLREAGLYWVEDLLCHKRFGKGAAKVLEAITARDAISLSRRGASDWDLAKLFRPEEFVFLDLETTGLYVTQPLFLVGLIYFEEGQLCLRQLLARSFEEEAGVISAAAEILRDRPVWVTYNGLTFDEPFLNGRLSYYLGEALTPQLHVDLLRHVRRHYRDVLPDCRLTTVETYILDAYRTGDIPGYMIPELYYQFVMYQEPALLEVILLHNARDLQTLVRLLGILQSL
jgi:uncharacterized protein YprB with RNaseH-like and TPR domain